MRPSLIAVLGLVLVAPALAARKNRLPPPRCVWIYDHRVYELRNTRIEGGSLRCNIKLATPKDAPAETPVRLVLRQERKDVAKTELKLALTPGGADEIELQVDVPADFDGCRSYELVMKVGDLETKTKGTGFCPD